MMLQRSSRVLALLLLGAASCALAAQLEPFTRLEIRDGLTRTVLIQPGANYSVSSDKTDLLMEVVDGTLTLKPNMTARTTGVSSGGNGEGANVINAVVSGLLSGLLNPAGSLAAANSTSPSPSSNSNTRASRGPITVQMPASALESLYSELNTADVVVGNFSATPLRSLTVTQNGAGRVVFLEVNVQNVDATSEGPGPLYIMGNIRNLTLTSSGVGPVYAGSSARRVAPLGRVSVTATGPPGGGDLILNPDNTNLSISGTTTGMRVLFSRGSCNVTAQAIDVFGAVSSVNVCKRAGRIDPPVFAPYWRLAAQNSSAMSPAGAPAAAPMGQVGYAVAVAPAPALQAPAPAPVRAAPAPAPVVAAPQGVLPSSLIMGPLLDTPTTAAAPDAATILVLAPAPAPAGDAAASSLQQIQPLNGIPAAAPASTDAAAPSISFFPATAVAADAPAPAVQTLPLRRRLMELA